MNKCVCLSSVSCSGKLNPKRGLWEPQLPAGWSKVHVINNLGLVTGA